MVNSMSFRATVVVASAITVTAGLLAAPAVQAVEPTSVATSAAAKKKPKKVKGVPAPTITIQAPDTLRPDRQSFDPEPGQVKYPTVVFGNAVDGLELSVDWGDGSDIETTTGSWLCTPARAKRGTASSCSQDLNHRYGDTPGTYTITARAGKVTATHTIQITQPPVKWTAPDGWVQPAGWSSMNTPARARYYACQNVKYLIDDTNAPADGRGLINDIPVALNMIAERSGLTFTPTDTLGDADLRLYWDHLQPGIAGQGGGSMVVFNIDSPSLKDNRIGFNPVTLPGYLPIQGGSWVIVHEVMHVLGFGHVDDPTALMHGNGNAGGFNAGDLDGLATMYGNVTCPAP